MHAAQSGEPSRPLRTGFAHTMIGQQGDEGLLGLQPRKRGDDAAYGRRADDAFLRPIHVRASTGRNECRFRRLVLWNGVVQIVQGDGLPSLVCFDGRAAGFTYETFSSVRPVDFEGGLLRGELLQQPYVVKHGRDECRLSIEALPLMRDIQRTEYVG